VLYIPCNDGTDTLWNGSEEDGNVRRVRKMQALAVKMETVTLISRCIESAYFVY
jgi:hypothetical protein